MMAWIRRIAITLAAALAVLGAVMASLAARFDPTESQRLAIEWMKSRHDRDLSIGGPARLTVLPWPRLRLADISLSEAGRPETFVAVDDATLDVDVPSLLFGRLAISGVQAQGVRIVLQRNAKGGLNFDDLLKLVTPPAPPPAPVPLSTPKQPVGMPGIGFAMGRLALNDVRARVKDDLAGIDGELVLKELESGPIESGRTSRIGLVAQFGFMSPALKGELKGSTRFTPDFATGSVRLSRMDLDYKGDTPDASSVDATLEGALAWNGAQSSLAGEGLELRLTANTAGLRLVDSTLAVQRVALDPSRKSFALQRMKLRIKGRQVGTPLALDLDWPELDVSGETLRGSALSGKFTYGSALPLAITFRSGAPNGNFDNVRVPAFEAAIRSRAPQRQVDGTLRSELVLQPAKRSALLDHIDLQLRVDEAGLRPLALSLTGIAVAEAGNTRWNLAGDINKNRFNTEGSVALAGITPSVKTVFRFQSLDLNSLLPAQPDGSAPRPETPIKLDALRSVNGSFALRFGNVVVRQYHARDVALDGTLEAGMLRVSSLRGNTWGGSFEGSAFADARASRLALRVRADGVNVSAFLNDVARRDLLQGNGRVDVDVESAGRTTGELTARLKGSTRVQLKDGAFMGADLPETLREARTALTAKKDKVFKADKAAQTAFAEMNASYLIDAGVARSSDLLIVSPTLRIEGEGALDIVRNRIDSRLRVTMNELPKGPEAPDLAALRGWAVPIQLNGPLDAVNWKVQWSEATALPARSVPRTDSDRRTRDRSATRTGPPSPGPRTVAPTAATDDPTKPPTKGPMP